MTFLATRSCQALTSTSKLSTVPFSAYVTKTIFSKSISVVRSSPLRCRTPVMPPRLTEFSLILKIIPSNISSLFSSTVVVRPCFYVPKFSELILSSSTFITHTPSLSTTSLWSSSVVNTKLKFLCIMQFSSLQAKFTVLRFDIAELDT